MKRRKVILASLAIGLLTAGLLFAFWNREPRHDGRSLSYWLEQIHNAGDMDRCEPALAAIRAMGTNALPFLLKNIEEAEQSWLERTLFNLVKRFPKLGPLLPPSTRNQAPTCLALKTLGTNCAPIVPELGRLAAERKTTQWAALALFSIGPAATPGLEIGCASHTQQIRVNSARFLCKIYERDHRDWSWGWNPGIGGKRLFGIGTVWGEEDVRALARLLRHENPLVRRASAEALHMHHLTDSASVLPNLKRAMKDKDGRVRRAASDAVMEIEEYLFRKSAGDLPP